MIERIEHRRGILTGAKQPEDLPLRVLSGADIPEQVLATIHKEELLELGGVYGDPSYGDPVQYDFLKLVNSEGESVEITVYNRAIMLFMADDERLRRIHRVLHILGEESER